MATKFLRKIILEELRKVLKEEVSGVPELASSGFEDFITTKAQEGRKDNYELRNTILGLNQDNPKDVVAFLNLIYGVAGAKMYISDSNDIVMAKSKLLNIKDRLKNNFEPLANDEAFNWHPPHQGANEKSEEPSPAVDVKTGYEISSEGKWGKSCPAARSAQREARRIIASKGDGWSKGKTLINRLKDSIMGATTISMINASIAKNNLGPAFSLNIQGARKACADTKIVPQAIKQMSRLGAEEIASAIEGTKPDSLVAASDQVKVTAEAKILEKRILEELAKMLGK